MDFQHCDASAHCHEIGIIQPEKHSINGYGTAEQPLSNIRILCSQIAVCIKSGGAPRAFCAHA